MKLICINSGSKGNGYALVAASGEILLLEAGCKVEDVQAAIDFKLNKVVGMLISHEHGDHAKYAKDYVKRGVHVYAHRFTIDALELSKNDNSHKLEVKELYHIGGFGVLAFGLNHDVFCAGYLITHKEFGTLVFITDTGKTHHVFPGCDVLMIECNYDEEIILGAVSNGFNLAAARRITQSHLSLQQACEFVTDKHHANIHKIVLCHLSSGNSHALNFKKEIQEITGKPCYIAEKGLNLQL